MHIRALGTRLQLHLPGVQLYCLICVSLAINVLSTKVEMHGANHTRHVP